VLARILEEGRGDNGIVWEDLGGVLLLFTAGGGGGGGIVATFLRSLLRYCCEYWIYCCFSIPLLSALLSSCSFFEQSACSSILSFIDTPVHSSAV
jgi:hypothetical protein